LLTYALGFPPPDSEVRDWLLESKTKAEALTHAYAFLCAMFVVLLRYLKQIDDKLAAVGVSSVGAESLASKFRLLMTQGQTFFHQGPTRKRFYSAILQLASEVSSVILILGTVLNGLLLQMRSRPSTRTGSTPPSSPKLSSMDAMSPQVYDLKEELTKLMAFLIPGFSVMNTYPPALIISFDEAHALAKVEVKDKIPPWSKFYEFRRALQVIQSYPCFSVFLATTGKVNQFMPDPGDSSRVQQELMTLITPFCELGYDQLAEKVVSNKTTLDDVASLRVMASMSRPL